MEQRIPNPCVASSSLARGASYFPRNQRFTQSIIVNQIQSFSIIFNLNMAQIWHKSILPVSVSSTEMGGIAPLWETWPLVGNRVYQYFQDIFAVKFLYGGFQSKDHRFDSCLRSQIYWEKIPDFLLSNLSRSEPKKTKNISSH